MIIRKPFAFIVKHFKIIHLLMIIPIIYLMYKSFNIMQFFSGFVSNGYLTKETNVAETYYNFLMPLACLVIVFITYFIYTLLKSKNKNYGVYLLTFIFYLVFFVICLFLHGILNSFQTTTIESSVALMYKGISNVFFFLQPVILILIILSAFGFNIRTFEFTDIKDEINLDDADSEEVELGVGVEDYKLKRGFRRYFRELKYYVIENKVVFTVLGVIAGIAIAVMVIMWVVSLNRVVKVDQSFTHSKFSVSFNDSLLSTLDYNGNVISNNQVYLAVKTTVKNNTKSLLTLDTDDFWLDINGTYYYPILNRSGKFLDLAKPYYGEKIGAGDSYEYVLVYELDSSLAQTSYTIKVLDSVTYKESEIIPKYKEITLTPEVSTQIIDNGEVDLGSELLFTNTNLLNSSLLINSVNISKMYIYTYQYCYNDKCSDSKNSISSSANDTLLILDGSLTLDENCSYYKYKLSNNNFAQDFMKVEYTINGKTEDVAVKDVTPSGETEKMILETSKNIETADSVKLIIVVRDQKYTYVLK